MSVNNQLVSIFIDGTWNVNTGEDTISISHPDNSYPMGLVVHFDTSAIQKLDEVLSYLRAMEKYCGDRETAED